MRGEEQKPVTQAYRDNWDAIFGKPEVEECSDCGVPYQCEKAPPVKTEPCGNCNGQKWDPAAPYLAGPEWRCAVCGGEGVIPIED